MVILTAYGTVEEAVEAMKLGAYDFIIKTVDLQMVDPGREPGIGESRATPSGGERIQG